MTINSTSRNIADSIIEITARKTRILLADHDIARLATRHEDLSYLSELINSDPKSYVRIRAEELEDEVIALRKAIGNIQEATSPYGVLASTNKRLLAEGYDVDSALPVINQLISEKAVNDTRRGEALCEQYGVEPLLVAELLLMHAKFQDLSILDSFGSVHFQDWDGIQSLSELFSTEIVSDDTETYLDQRFINYLKENAPDLQQLHWRNFERLVAQFFASHGYTVLLGPGSKDGGIDIRIWKDAESRSGPPLLLVQCKRYSKRRIVSVHAVKAFYADVLHERAEVGLIATTSRLSSGGKSTISARGYNIAVAESTQINEMIHGMWRKSFRDKG